MQLSVLLLALICNTGLGQNSPLGEVVGVRQVVPPPSVRRSLPAAAAFYVVRRMASGEDIVVYTKNAQPVEFQPHIAVVTVKGVVSDYDLSLFDESLGSYAFSADRLLVCAGAETYIFAFRSVGDGSGTAFAVLRKMRSAGWRPVLVQRYTQAVLTANDCGMKLSIEYAMDGDECTWCEHA